MLLWWSVVAGDAVLSHCIGTPSDSGRVHERILGSAAWTVSLPCLAVQAVVGASPNLDVIKSYPNLSQLAQAINVRTTCSIFLIQHSQVWFASCSHPEEELISNVSFHDHCFAQWSTRCWMRPVGKKDSISAFLVWTMRDGLSQSWTQHVLKEFQCLHVGLQQIQDTGFDSLWMLTTNAQVFMAPNNSAFDAFVSDWRNKGLDITQFTDLPTELQLQVCGTRDDDFLLLVARGHKNSATYTSTNTSNICN